ncbi:hypothetical protein C4F51_09930 [Cellvibrio sp. KB43]|uniref:Integrase catalytic domain-containing protein n=2 Tax=Cellvibrio polysaccharolyticus TaxID=2082724 RepID=A0A928YVV7_9GAMM|nr:hypothetical protein [Cellvibrio polysaccharolyticus]
MTPRNIPDVIFQDIEIDEHTVDCHGSIVIIINDKWEPLRVSRITLISARDVASAAILAVVLVLGTPSKDDLLALFAALTRAWQNLTLTAPGLTYPPREAMPTALGRSFIRPAYGVIRFDNAMIHRAIAVRDYVCDQLGATFNLGFPKYPLARVLIEGAFKNLNLTIHRIPSTTGSSPVDPLKEPEQHAKKAPLISIKVLEEAIHLHMAHLNQKPLGNLGGVAPIDLMRHQMANHWIPLRPTCAVENINPMKDSRVVPVHFSRKERRRPWVNFAYLSYEAAGVLSAVKQGVKIRIEFDRSDLRLLEAFNLKGEHLGTLRAPRNWQRFPHGLSTRKKIMNLIKIKAIQSDDPFGSYFDYLLCRRTLPTSALELVRVSREFGDYPQMLSPNNRPIEAPLSPIKKTESASIKPDAIPDWSPNMVVKRRPE